PGALSTSCLAIGGGLRFAFAENPAQDPAALRAGEESRLSQCRCCWCVAECLAVWLGPGRPLASSRSGKAGAVPPFQRSRAAREQPLPLRYGEHVTGGA